MRSEEFVVLLSISAMKARDPRGVRPATAGSSCSRFIEVDATQEASKRVAAAPIAAGAVVFREDASVDGHE